MVHVGSQPFKYIIWAVDPFSEKPGIQRRTAKVLSALTKRMLVAIEPVYIHTPEFMNLIRNPSLEPGLNFRDLAEQKLIDSLKAFKLPGLQNPTLLIQENTSVRGSVGKLLAHARQRNSDLICTSTTVKKGWDRIFLGSFAESLLLQSDIPTLVVGPKTRIRQKITQILFPSDFSPVSKDTFEKVVAFARELKAQITLFHKVEILSSYALPYYPTPHFMEEQVSLARNKAEEWVKSAKEEGVDCGFVLDERPVSVVQGILAEAKKMPSGIIAMASQTGPVTSVILGSVTRMVVRQAPCPVWTIHPQKYMGEKNIAA